MILVYFLNFLLSFFPSLINCIKDISITVNSFY